ncbi:hypothetical protein LAUMK142_03334 [Mycobacterium pseudokansasii]|uniref:Uncharacterized protein n=1 Tax=Mycobacterium pseudokansasii TaxID=2341080 RepID=A0A498QTY3_9MYCO|nr:hypothetical protein LAUMK142_03334 [Mycobacterium pseudokansasii]
MHSIRAGFLHLLASFGHRVDILNLSYGERRISHCGAMPWGVTAVLVQSEHTTTAEEHDAFSGLASLSAGESCGAAVSYGARGPGRVGVSRVHTEVLPSPYS